MGSRRTGHMIDARDVRTAYFRMHLRVDEFMAEVERAKARRLLDECTAEMKRLTATHDADGARRLNDAKGKMDTPADYARWLKRRNAIERIFKRHDELMKACYPDVPI